MSERASDRHSDELLAQVAALPCSCPACTAISTRPGQVLYVGKARNLKKRVSSYFQKNHGGTRIGHMVRARSSGWRPRVVRSEAEALILENNLIKQLGPESTTSCSATTRATLPQAHGHGAKALPALAEGPADPADFPRMAYYRGAVDKRHRYFGPYPNAWAVKETIQLLQKVFRLRTCEDTVFANRTRPCLLYQIKRCTGPLRAAGQRSATTPPTWRTPSASCAARPRPCCTSWSSACWRTPRSWSSSRRPSFATRWRRSPACCTSRRWRWAQADVDILAVKVQGGRACVNLAMVRGGRHLGDRAYFPSHVEDAHALAADRLDEADGELPTVEAQVLDAFIAQHYLGTPAPAQLITSEPVSRALLQALSDKEEVRITATHAPRSQRRTWLQMAAQNAALQLARLLSEEGSQQARTRALAEALDLPADELAALRIECFDISHTAGEATQASCVVFENHRMQSGEYRRFKIEGITPGDDYAAMRQVLSGATAASWRRCAPRRTKRRAGPGWRAPARPWCWWTAAAGQVAMAREVFEGLGLDLALIVGVEKGEGRKVGLEELVFADGRPQRCTWGTTRPR